ncbi:YkgJ family cysteine cluster protein [archaeon]|jgi:uncharacterized protein|nr:YkgJ family cysteine cluster protein [Candidatus Woesearchaeota archaeon]MBT4135868.1 YkgJ family cysteine cluster protein [archaeon]MBT4242228.1 YkgJ family cysteine cluster protein [archaeon]MBT4417916.1 YkgJ family cysteine cluster protein [archaeon]
MGKKLSCEGCKAKCCKYICVEIDKPEDKEDYEHILWYLVHKDVSVFIEGKEWYIQFDTPCNKLDEKYMCKIYDKRPEICKKLSIENCEKHGAGEAYDVLFKNVEDFVKYMADKGVEIRDLG